MICKEPVKAVVVGWYIVLSVVEGIIGYVLSVKERITINGYSVFIVVLWIVH